MIHNTCIYQSYITPLTSVHISLWTHTVLTSINQQSSSSIQRLYGWVWIQGEPEQLSLQYLLKGSPTWFKHITQCLSHSGKHLCNSCLAMHSSAACNSAVFMIPLKLQPFNHVSIFENQNKQWRLSWRSKEARHHHHLFSVRHQKKPWIRVAWHVVMMQQPVLCVPLVGNFLPTASIITLSTPMQNSWFTSLHWRKNFFWRTA